jgi:hypothetical protein
VGRVLTNLDRGSNYLACMHTTRRSAHLIIILYWLLADLGGGIRKEDKTGLVRMSQYLVLGTRSYHEPFEAISILEPR